jgi:hypothetical protein
MGKKKILVMVVFTILSALSLLLITGCPHIDSPYGLKVTGGGTGGAIALYRDKVGGKVYAQKISPDGELMWGEKGVLQGKGNDENIISDGSGGAIMVWSEYTSQEPPKTSVFHIVKLDLDGLTVWQKDFENVGQIISNGSGGAIFLHSPEEEALFLGKIDSTGAFPWGENGVPLDQVGSVRQMISDGAGGAIIIWKESQYPAGVAPGKTTAVDSLFALRISAAGELLWGDEQGNGILIYEFPEGTWIDSIQSIEDGYGGVIMAWYQVTENASAEPGHQQFWDIIVQRVDAGGNILWQPEGVPFEISQADPTALPMEPALVEDVAGGAIVIWRDTRHDAQGEASIYAQKIDEDGNLLWQDGGIKVSSTSLNPFPQITIGNPVEAIIVYSFQEDGKTLHAQKIGSNGQVLWQDNGIPITESGFSRYSIVSDGQGGIIIGWGVGSGKAFVQRISADGELIWGEDGIRLNR